MKIRLRIRRPIDEVIVIEDNSEEAWARFDEAQRKQDGIRGEHE